MPSTTRASETRLHCRRLSARMRHSPIGRLAATTPSGPADGGDRAGALAGSKSGVNAHTRAISRRVTVKPMTEKSRDAPIAGVAADDADARPRSKEAPEPPSAHTINTQAGTRPPKSPSPCYRRRAASGAFPAGTRHFPSASMQDGRIAVFSTFMA